MRIGITGGIGAGKSLVCSIFEILGIPTYNADFRAKVLMQKDVKLKQQIIDLFGSESYQDNSLNTGYISNQAFFHPEMLDRLNSLVHPAVSKDFTQWENNQEKASYVLKEAALLFETGSYRKLDGTILVVAPENLRIERVKARDPQRGESQIKAIIEKQLPDKEKLKLADYVITNEESELLIPPVLAIHKQILSNKKASD